jgi:hypothetical protein
MSSLTATLKSEAVYAKFALQQLANRRIITELPDNLNAYYNRAICVQVKTEESRYMTDKPFMPRVTLSYLKHLLLIITTNHTLLKETISHLYATGIGLPFSDKLSIRWKESVLDKDERMFGKLRKRLAQDIETAKRDSPDGVYAYMEDFYALDTALAKAVEYEKIDDPRNIGKYFSPMVKDGTITKHTSMTVSIALAGIPVVLMYRKQLDGTVALVDAHLQGNYSQGEKDALMFPHIASMNTVPSVLATKTSGYLDRMNKYLSTDLGTFLVTGTLTIPESLRKKMKKNLPKVKNIKQLLRHVVADKIALDIPKSEAHEALTPEFESVFGVVNSISHSDGFGSMTPGKLQYKQAELAESATYMRKLQHKLRMQSEARGKLSRKEQALWKKRKASHKVLKAETEKYQKYADQLLSDFSSERDARNAKRRKLREKRGERYLRFVANDIMGFNAGWEPINFGLQEHTRTHLSSLRFHTHTHLGAVTYGIVPRANAGNARVYKSIIHKLRKVQESQGGEYTITGLYVQPNKTVNMGRSIKKVLISYDQL